LVVDLVYLLQDALLARVGTQALVRAVEGFALHGWCQRWRDERHTWYSTDVLGFLRES
jgi:hypothetical protein